MLLNFSEQFFEDAGHGHWVRSMMLANPHPQPAEAFIRQLEACGRHDARERLRSLELPAHVIGSEYDMLVPVWKSHELAELIPGARLTVVLARAARRQRRARRGVQQGGARLHRRASAGCRLSRFRRPRRSASSSVWSTGAARSNSTISSTRATGLPPPPPRAAPARLPSRRARLKSIAMPLESMNSSPLKSTTSARAEVGTASPIALARGRRAGEVELARHAGRSRRSPRSLDLELNEVHHCRLRPTFAVSESAAGSPWCPPASV